MSQPPVPQTLMQLAARQRDLVQELYIEAADELFGKLLPGQPEAWFGQKPIPATIDDLEIGDTFKRTSGKAASWDKVYSIDECEGSRGRNVHINRNGCYHITTEIIIRNTANTQEQVA